MEASLGQPNLLDNYEDGFVYEILSGNDFVVGSSQAVYPQHLYNFVAIFGIFSSWKSPQATS